MLRSLAELLLSIVDILKPVRSGYTCSGRKSHLEKECRVWINRISDMQYLDREPEDEKPDIYSFYSELCALRTELRKSTRRSQESLIHYDKTISELGCEISRFLPDRREKDGGKAEGILKKKRFYLPVVEIYERLIRLQENLRTNDHGGGFFTRLKKTGTITKDSKEGLSILIDNFKSMLENNNIKRVVTVGKIFDPLLMIGIEVEENETVEPNMVVKEFSGGYMLGEHVLKLAEVTVAKRKGWTNGNNSRN